MSKTLTFETLGSFGFIFCGGFKRRFCGDKKNSQWRKNSYKNASWVNVSPLAWLNEQHRLMTSIVGAELDEQRQCLIH